MEHCFEKTSYWYKEAWGRGMIGVVDGQRLDDYAKSQIEKAKAIVKKYNGNTSSPMFAEYYYYEYDADDDDIALKQAYDPLMLFVKDGCLWVLHIVYNDPKHPEYVKLLQDNVLSGTWSCAVGSDEKKAILDQYGVIPNKLFCCGPVRMYNGNSTGAFLCTEWSGELKPTGEYFEEEENVEVLKIPLNRLDEYYLDMKTMSLLDCRGENYITWAVLLFHAGLL